MKKLAVFALIALIAAPLSAKTTPAKRGLAFAKTHCAACHGITANSSSPNPEAPPWDDIANRPGTTRETLRVFLRDSHNYPDAMQFTVKRSNIGDLAAYMITLQRKGYHPGI
jgi:mono/diheme cytochrome c family protein